MESFLVGFAFVIYYLGIPIALLIIAIAILIKVFKKK